jgi:hypothetical protein
MIGAGDPLKSPLFPSSATDKVDEFRKGSTGS